MPTPRQAYQTLHPQLTTLADEISAQARPRPQVLAAPLVLRIAHRLLRQVRALISTQIPNLPKQGEVTLGELSATLGQARAALQVYGQANGFDTKPSPTTNGHMAALRKKLARRIDELRAG